MLLVEGEPVHLVDVSCFSGGILVPMALEAELLGGAFVWLSGVEVLDPTAAFD